MLSKSLKYHACSFVIWSNILETRCPYEEIISNYKPNYRSTRKQTELHSAMNSKDNSNARDVARNIIKS